MKRKIFSTLAIMVTAAVVVTAAFFALFFYNNQITQLKQTMANDVVYITELFEKSNQDYSAIAEIMAGSTTRVTIVLEDGSVSYDNFFQTALDNMDNYNTRPEIVEAREKGLGFSVRKSNTLGGINSYYTAKVSKTGEIIRVSYSAKTLLATMASTFNSLAILVAGVIILAIFVANILTKRIIDPINKIDLAEPLSKTSYQEIYPFLSKIRAQNMQISRQVEQLEQLRNEFNLTIEGMQEGLVILASTGEIISLNPAAADILAIDANSAMGKYILELNRSEGIRLVVENMARSSSYSDTVVFNNRTYQMISNPVQKGGCLIFFLDVTEKHMAETQRREFSSNVSHELKTPLQSILGYAELIKSGIAKKSDWQGFCEKIHVEASRLLSMIEDIMKISRLEEGAEIVFEEVDALTVLKSVACSLAYKAQEKGVAIVVEGEQIFVNSCLSILNELVYNLGENAVKYNKQGGSVTLSLEKDNDKTAILVTDTGIGIDKNDLPRIFERFYRADKSHNKAIEGTGLGLSIAKYAAKQINAEITVSSVLGEGSTFKIIL